MKRATEWVRDLYDCLQRARTFGLAAETAFWVFLALVPLAAVAGLVAARFTTDNWNEFSPVLGALPDATRGLVAAELVKVSRWNRGAVGITGTLVFLWLASSGVHAIFEALELETTDHTDSSRPWWQKRLLALGTCLGLSVVVAALAILGPGLEGSLGKLSEEFPGFSIFGGPPTTLGRILRFAASLVMALGYVSGLYWLGVPPAARRKMPILPGAVVAVLLQVGLSFGYSTYIAHMGSGSAYTAGLAIIGLTLMGIYLFVVALLTGAVVNKKIGLPGERQIASAETSRPPPTA